MRPKRATVVTGRLSRDPDRRSPIGGHHTKPSHAEPFSCLAVCVALELIDGDQ